MFFSSTKLFSLYRKLKVSYTTEGGRGNWVFPRVGKQPLFKGSQLNLSSKFNWESGVRNREVSKEHSPRGQRQLIVFDGRFRKILYNFPLRIVQCLCRRRVAMFIVAVILIVAFFSLNYGTFAANEVNSDDLECQWEKIEAGEKELSRDDYRTLLEKCKKFYEEKSKLMEKEIGKTANEKKTLANAIAALKNKVQNLDYKISQSNIMIKDLASQIKNTESSISQTNLKIEEIKEHLINILQLRYEEDQKSTIEIFLSEQTLSSFFDNLVALEALNLTTQDLLKDIKNLKLDLEEQKITMDNEKKELENVVVIQSLQKKESAKEKKDQEYFLQLTELEYQKYLKEKQDAQQKATKIGNLLFELLQVPEGGIKFEDAIEFSKSIAPQAGVRPAFSLAVLWQETRIGKLKGGCYLKDTATGDGIYIKTGNKAPRTMKPTTRTYEKLSDVALFEKIIKGLNEVKRLETDVFHTPVSCCMYQNGSLFGWGGAMGPAQFIPNTWMLYKEEIEKKTGDMPANPWNVRDAFLANALLLRDNGASSKTYEKELRAALKYFGCTSDWCKKYYGEPVMKVSTCFQQYIDKNYMSDACKDLIF